MPDMAMDTVLDIMAVDMAMDSDTMVATDTTARGLLRPSPRPRLRLIPTTMVDTVWAMPDMAMDTVLDIMAVDMAMDSDTMVATDTTARGLLRLSPRPRLRLIPTTMVDTVWAMLDMAMAADTMVMAADTAMDSDTMVATDTTERGLLRLSPRPRLIPTTMVDTVWAMPDMADMVWATDMPVDMVWATDMAMDMATTVKPEDPILVPALHQPQDLVIHQDLSVNHQLPPCQQKMDCIISSFPKTSAASFSAGQTSLLVMASRKQENQNVMIRQIKIENLLF